MSPTSMRAVVITAFGGPDVLEIQSRPVPEPGLGQVRVRVWASSINRADISQRLGRYPAPPGAPPDIPGLEYAGEVNALGEGASLWRPGMRVMGIAGGGGHAEYICAHEREVIPVPAELKWEEAAAIPEVFLTAYDAMFRQLQLQSAETLLIHAAGSGVGTAAIQLARVAGIETIGTSRSPAKLQRCVELGLGRGVDASHPDWVSRVREHTGGKGVSAVLDLVGAGYLAGNLDVLSERGRMIVVGLASGARSEIDLGVVMHKRLRINGTVLRARPLEEKISLAREFAERMLHLFADGRLKPVVDSVLPFSDIRAAHARMEENSNFGKIVLRWD